MKHTQVGGRTQQEYLSTVGQGWLVVVVGGRGSKVLSVMLVVVVVRLYNGHLFKFHELG